MSDLLPVGRSVRFYPGHDHGRGEEPDEQYGIHGMEVAFYLRGEEGAVQFKFYTDWVPWRPKPSLDEIGVARYENRNNPLSRISSHFPMAVDLGYHASRKINDWLEPRECHLLGGECYYDGSGLNAERVLVKLIYDGDEAVWAALERYYQQVFMPEEDAS